MDHRNGRICASPSLVKCPLFRGNIIFCRMQQMCESHPSTVPSSSCYVPFIRSINQRSSNRNTKPQPLSQNVSPDILEHIGTQSLSIFSTLCLPFDPSMVIYMYLETRVRQEHRAVKHHDATSSRTALRHTMIPFWFPKLFGTL